MTLAANLSRALDGWRNGDPAEAERICRTLLADHPNHPAVLAVLVLAVQSGGDSGVALDLVRRAIAGASLSAELHHNAGVILTALGRLEEALPYFHQAIVLAPSLRPPGSEPGGPRWRDCGDGAVELDLGFTVDAAHARAARLIPPRFPPPGV